MRRPRDVSRQQNADSGFALVFVLVVIAILMAGAGTLLTVASSNAARAATTQGRAGALTAAQSGVDDVVAWLDSIPACRAMTRMCAQAFGASSAALAAKGQARPSLSSGASFSWRTGTTVTDDGYLRVYSTGTVGDVSRSLTADLSLIPSILNYGYYTDYETQAPAFFDSYFTPRSVYVTDSSTYNQISSNTRGSSTVPQTVTWNGAPSGASLGYPDTVCGEHWWAEGSSKGRAVDGSSWYESGTVNGKTVYHGSVCDLVFTSGMTEDGPTYTRDAMLISSGTGSGPSFLQPVYTLWGYPGHNSPAAPAQPWRKNDSNATLASSTYQPQIARGDLTLPASIGSDTLADNSCVYTGPTRVVLNGDGTATVTSPNTKTKNAKSDSACYPSVVSNGVIGWTVNYRTTGGGIIYAKNLNPPSGGWPQSALKSTSTPSANNEIFYLPTTGTASPDASTSTAPSTCSSSATYSANSSAGCAWTNLSSATDGGSSKGWTSYSTTSTKYCNSSPAATDRLLFECEFSGTTGAKRPASDQYAVIRSADQSALASGSCTTGATSDQTACIVSGLNSQLTPANTSGHPANYASPANGDHQYVAKTSVGTATTGTTQDVGSVPGNPTSSDDFFTFTGQKARETATLTPTTVTVYRQTYSSSSKAWSTGTPQFSFTVTHTDWKVTQQPSGASYFPNPQDVTTYDIGATSSGAVAGQNGTAQPGDLYVEGKNSGQLSLIADNNVEVTGDIKKDQDDSSATSPLSLTAGGDVRNYHPVTCTDQNTTDINNTTAGWCPNDVTGLVGGTVPADQYDNLDATGPRTIDAAIFTLTGSFRTDNYDRADFVGNLNVYGGLYQSHRGANGTQSGDGSRTGTSLQYHYVDLTRANLPYAPAATDSTNPRPWNVVSISSG